jgi:hypothetical protein
MTKLTFDVDFTKDPEEILREIQEQAKQEVAKHESKERASIYLSKLHEVVNHQLGTSYKSLSELVRVLTALTKPGSFKGKTPKISPTGRRITISMTQELYNEIKTLLAKPSPNKAAIARETGVSVVQVRKVATGGFDSKFSKGFTKSTKPTAPSPVSKPTLPELPKPSTSAQPNQLKLPSPSFSDDISSSKVADSFSGDDTNAEFAPPSFGEEESLESTPVAPPLSRSSTFELPPLKPKLIADSPLTSSSNKDPEKLPPPDLAPKSPPKPNLKIKPKNKKPAALKITRPPMRPPSA